MKKTVWVVVADEAIARVLQWDPRHRALHPVEESTDPAAHARAAEFHHDAAGRRASGSASPVAPGGGTRSPAGATASAGEDERHLEAGVFAARVAGRLAEALRTGRYEELRIVAAPRFLGLLRKAMDPQVARVVTTELDKDMVHFGNAEIAAHLFAEPPRA